MVQKIREYFHITENHQQYLNEWRTIMLRDVIAANPDKDLP
jgi:DNA-binding PadR family transcriptional regulator